MKQTKGRGAKMRKFSCNSKTYTDEHNNIMDSLLWSLVNFDNKRIRYVIDSQGRNYYTPLNEEGTKILEYLRDIDLIEEIFDEEEV